MSLVNINAKNISTNFEYNIKPQLPNTQKFGYYSYLFSFNLLNPFVINQFERLDYLTKQYNNILSNTPKFPSIKSFTSGHIGEMLEEAGYDSEKGKLLTKAAKKRARENNWTGYCARNVRFSFEETHLASGDGNGHAYQYAETLSHNKNFKEIDVSNLSKSDLIELSKYDGIVYVYGRGVSNYSKKSGHIEISLGNGTNGSDGITHNIRKGARVFIPVKASMLA